jgi:hypothetical protein
MKNNKWIEFGSILSCLIFAIAISFFHLSSVGEDGPTPVKWSIIWTISENGLGMSISLLISLLTEGFVKFLFRWIFVPYFIIKLIYHISCYTGIILLPLVVWSWFWSIELIVFFAVMFILCMIYIIKEKK